MTTKEIIEIIISAGMLLATIIGIIVSGQKSSSKNGNHTSFQDNEINGNNNTINSTNNDNSVTVNQRFDI